MAQIMPGTDSSGLSANTSLASLLSGIFSGSYGLNQLFGSGSSTAAGSAAAGAAAASPFQSQFGQYQGQVQGALNNAQSYQNQLQSILQGFNIGPSITNLNNIASQAGQLNPAVTGNAANNPAIQSAGSDLTSQVSALAGNYMSNPAIQAQYNLGLQTAERGIQAAGYGGSGQQMVELQNYGQQFASQAYQQQLQDILSTNSQAFQENLGSSQFSAGLQQQSFGNSLQQLLSQSQLTSAAPNLALAQQGQAISGYGTLGNMGQGTLNALGLFSGASTGSPATAGSILSGQFGNSQTAAGNLGSGLSGILSGINGLTGGNLGTQAGDFLNSLLGNSGSYGSLLSGGISQWIDSFGGGIGSLGSSLGSASTGGLESLIAGGADTAGSEGLSALLGL